jgi:hypothetical protein
VSTFHGQYLALVEQLERAFPVTEWRCGDVEVWPLARMDLYLDMYWSQANHSAPVLRPMPLRALSRAATPVRNLWKSRRDLSHWVVRPHQADAVFLGDGLSLDLVDGAWQDRFCDPLIAELERQGRRTFLMQAGELTRLPWARPTFAANMLAAWGALRAGAIAPALQLPQYEALMSRLHSEGIVAPSLRRDTLWRRAGVVFATAQAFEHVLRIVKPSLAFVVTYYAGLGPAFLLACRRLRILSVDLQHCPQDGAHKAYGWWSLPAAGYATLPAVFWSWTERDAAYIQGWVERLHCAWHSGIHGGHTQWAGYLAAHAARTDQPAASTFEREILIALQSTGVGRGIWNSLRAEIERAPKNWRWWVRRHPASTPDQDAEHQALLSIEAPNVVVDAATAAPLPALLARMHAMVSVASGAAAEAAAWGVPSFFLSEQARSPFAQLIEEGAARVVSVKHLVGEIERSSVERSHLLLNKAPPLAATLESLSALAQAYQRVPAP